MRRVAALVVLALATGLFTSAHADAGLVLYEQDTYVDFNATKAVPGITSVVESYSPLREICVAIAKDGQLLFQRSFGGADCDEPVSIASVTKYFTADAVYKSGVPLDTVVEPSRNITVDDLLHMKIGMDREKMSAFGVGLSYPFGYARQAAVIEQYGALHPMHVWEHVMATEPQQYAVGGNQAYSTLAFARLGEDYPPDIPFDTKWLMCGGGCAGKATAAYTAKKASQFDDRVWAIWPVPISGVLERASNVTKFTDGVTVVILAERVTAGDWTQTAPMAQSVKAAWDVR